MKLSLAWIFDHIDADWKTQDVDHIMRQFNKTTAEIESFYKVSYDLSHFFLAKVMQHSPASVQVFIPELDREHALSFRTDLRESSCPLPEQPIFMVKKEGDRFVWATLADFGSEKDGLMPMLDATEHELGGQWRQAFQADDVVLEVDNKSITHRPDMWGHRGFAREIAAFLQLPLKPKELFLQQLPVMNFDHCSAQTGTTAITLTNQAPGQCKRFSGLYFSSIENRPSNLFITSRLLKVGNRPINALVDMTNYVTNDWSQPVHAYDAEKIEKGHIIIRLAHEGEKFMLLDGTEVSLTSQDLIIADDKKPMCLAGVKGGMHSGVTATTKSIFFESANFDAGSVRRSAQRHKTRTDSSARFEKTLDPNQATETIGRFVALLETFGIKAVYAQEIIALGHDVSEPTIEISHSFLEQRIGVTLTSTQIMDLLARLEFRTVKSHDREQNIIYLVHIPSFRASKDIKIREDILEEVVRAYGFENIPLQMPKIIRTPFDFSQLMRLRSIKSFFARAARMTEQQNYSLYDQQHIALLGLRIEPTVSLLNPISENHVHMITSLVPGLLKNIQDNHVQADTLSFFECGRIWTKPSSDKKPETGERKSIAGIFFKKRVPVDFYECKDLLNQLFIALGQKDLTFIPTDSDQHQQSWYRAYQTAAVMYGNKYVGIAGKADPVLLSKLGIDVECDAFIFELDGDFLINQKAPEPYYQPLSKFQETYFDLSLFVPLQVQSAMLQENLAAVDDMITKVELVDFFEKEAWPDVRALTFRVWLVHPDKTLEKFEIDQVWQKAVAAAQALNVQVRM